MPEDQCIQYVRKAAEAENAGIALDRANNSIVAIRKYEECERSLEKAVELSSPWHLDDQPKLVQHRAEILKRIEYLKDLGGGPGKLPVEEHIKAVQLSMKVEALKQKPGRRASTATTGGIPKGEMQELTTFGAAAGLGAAAGFLVLGGPVAIIGGALAGGFLSTRENAAGDATRGVAGAAVAAGGRAAELNREHRVTSNLCAAGSAAVERVQDTNERYNVSGTVMNGVASVCSSMADFEGRYHVLDKVAATVSGAASAVATALSPRGAARPKDALGPSQHPDGTQTLPCSKYMSRTDLREPDLS